MAWTTPRTYTVAEIITKSILDTHVRDNLKYLKGESGVVTTQSGLIISNALGTEYLTIPSLTTTQRDALTPTAGMLVYNSTTTQFNKYENGAWRADLGFNSAHSGLSGLTSGDDHTQYQKEDLLTTQGDIPYATAASTWARLPKGTAGQALQMNGGATAPEWAGNLTVTSEFAAGTTLRNSSDIEKSTTSASYVKLKESKLNDIYTSITVKFDLKLSTVGDPDAAFGRIYKNGSPVGIERSTYSATYTTYSESFSSLVANDLIQVYAYATGVARTAYVQNLRFYYNENILTVGGKTLTTGLECSTVRTITNQDP